MVGETHVVWGPELSPFLLKLEAMLAWAGVPQRRLPRDGSRAENLRTTLLVERAKAARTARRPLGDDDALDEYPLVPFLVTPSRDVLYDSSAIARWLDRDHAPDGGPLLPGDAATRFVASFLDEAFDEFGLYMVHHNRWKLAAGDNGRPGMRLAREYARQIPPGVAPLFATWFERRQVRRLPYLFSVAPRGYTAPGVAAAMTPPSRDGFPPTHELLEHAWERTLAAIAAILGERPFLLGERFTIADASAYGQLSMNLTDTAAARRLRELAPSVHDWLVAIRDRRHVAARGSLVDVAGCAALRGLLAVFADTFVPLMRANEAAFDAWRARGETVFNEKAFDAGRALYDGSVAGHPFRSVAKSFQARTWRDLRRGWEALDASSRARVEAAFGGQGADAMFAPPRAVEAVLIPR